MKHFIYIGRKESMKDRPTDRPMDKTTDRRADRHREDSLPNSNKY